MKKYIPDDELPSACPKCGHDLEPETDPVKGGFLTKLVCTNSDCTFEVDWCFDTEQDAAEDWQNFLEESSR